MVDLIERRKFAGRELVNQRWVATGKFWDSNQFEDACIWCGEAQENRRSVVLTLTGLQLIATTRALETIVRRSKGLDPKPKGQHPMFDPEEKYGPWP